MSYLLTSIAFRNIDNVSSVDAIAEYFHRIPGRFLVTLRRHADEGYLTIGGTEYQWVVPTIAALRQHDARLSEAAARAILQRIDK